MNERDRQDEARLETPIYVKSAALCRYLLDRIDRLCKDRQSELGRKIASLALDLVETIAAALHGRSKAENIDKADGILLGLRTHIRLLYDFAIIDLRQLEQISLNIDEIGRMIGSWKRKTTKDAQLRSEPRS